MRRESFTPEAPGTLFDVTVTIKDPLRGEMVDITSPAFVPQLLPRTLALDGALALLLEEALHQMGTLSGITTSVPTGSILLRPFMRREAVTSSRIEGTTTTYLELVAYEQLTMLEQARRPSGEPREVLSYVRAMEYGFAQPKERGLPLALIRELHAMLMDSDDRLHVTPGRFRRSVVFVGGQRLQTARFVPPPPHQVMDLMIAFERQIQVESTIPRLVWIGMLHYLFEAIHPFNDGNGRVGRILILLMLRQFGLIRDPMLHLSNFIDEHKSDYLHLLLTVSTHGDWGSWNEFMLTAFAHEAARSVRVINQIQGLRVAVIAMLGADRDAALIGGIDAFLAEAQHSIGSLASATGSSYNTGKRIMQRFVDVGFVRQVSAGSRNRVFQAPAVLEIFEGEG